MNQSLDGEFLLPLTLDGYRDSLNAGYERMSVQALTAGYGWTQRKVDDVLFPTRGYLVNWQISGAKRAFLSDRDFIRGYGKLTCLPLIHFL